MKFVKNTKYYTGTVYEWNLPTGSTCPFALDCKVTVDRHTGKFHNESNAYKCYAANPERFPGVREHRWKNFESVRQGIKPVLPRDCKAVRIHASGDFFNQAYFDSSRINTALRVTRQLQSQKKKFVSNTIVSILLYITNL